MLRWALAFLVLAVVAGLLGFGLIVGLSLLFAKILFFVFLFLFLVSLLRGRRARRV